MVNKQGKIKTKQETEQSFKKVLETNSNEIVKKKWVEIYFYGISG